MDAFRLADLSNRILSGDECPLYILIPAWKLLGRLCIFFAVGTLLLTLTFSLWAIVTIPVLVFWSYLYILFCHVWKRYRLSGFYIVLTPICALSLAAGIRYILYAL